MLNASVRLYVINIPDYFKTQQLQKRALSVFMFPHNGFSRALNKMYDEAINKEFCFVLTQNKHIFYLKCFLFPYNILSSVSALSFVYKLVCGGPDR